MAKKNLIIPLSNSDPNYIYSNVRYARIDNTVAPVYTQVNNVTANPLVISGVDNGQYRIYARPVFSDGRLCGESQTDTAACTGINSLNAVFTDPNFVISYSAEAGVPFVRVNINYPNGGFSNTIYTNDGLDITIPAPVGIYGTYTITMQPVCDEDTGWFGDPTAGVTVEITEPSP